MIYKNPKIIQDVKVFFKEAIIDCYIFGKDKFVNSWNTTAVSVKYKPKSIKEIDDII